MTVAQRNRLVTEQDGQEHVHGLPLFSEDEIKQALDIEERMHTLAGWTVKRKGNELRLRKGDSIRRIWVRSREPMEDTL